jgi:hypothetical protein
MAGYTKTYEIPQRELEAIRNPGMSYEDARTSRDGLLASWIERSRSGNVIVLQERGQGWAVEITLDGGGDIASVVALSPEQARALQAR